MKTNYLTWEQFKKEIKNMESENITVKSVLFGWVACCDSIKDAISTIKRYWMVNQFHYNIVKTIDNHIEITIER